MRKALLALVGAVLVVAAAWTGLWFYGKGQIVQEIETQAQLIRARGGQASYEGIEVGGFPLGYAGRILAPEISMARDAPTREGFAPARDSYAWSAPWIEASATVMAPDTVTFTFPETQDITLDLPEMEGTPLPVALTSKDLIVTTTRQGADILFRGGAQAMGGSFSRLSGEMGDIDLTSTTRDFAFSGKVTPEARSQMTLDYTIAGFDGTVTVAGTAENPGGTVDFTGGAITTTLDSMAREATGTATLADLGATLRFAPLGEEPLEFGIGKVEVATRMPNDAAPDPQDFAYRIAIETVTVADPIWTMLDPVAAFPREIDSLVIDMEGTAVFNAAPSNAEAFARAMESGLPVDVDTLKLNTLTVDALGLKAVATGAGSLENDVPRGAATLAVDGFPDIMNSLVKSGRIPPQQVMVVQLMVESFGKLDEGGETIHFDFEAHDGMMYVNSIPMGEAPSMP